MPSTLPYGLLRQTHPPDPPHDRGYDAKVWAELDDLYRGGYQIQEHAARYLPKAVGESDERYRERLHLAAYIGYFGKIVNLYVAAIFGQPVSVVPAGDADDSSTPGELPDADVYSAFGRDADLRGCSFEQVLRRATTTALVKCKALIAVDFPAMESQPMTRADSDRMGSARPYCYAIEPEELIDWEYDSEIQRRVEIDRDHSVEFTVGCFRWCILRRVLRRRDDPESARSKPVEEYRIWRRREDGVVVWQVYRTPPIEPGQPLPDLTPIPLVAEGETTFAEIPIVEVKLPDTLWLGNIIGLLNKEHWQRRSALLAAQQRSLLVIPVVRLGPEGMAVGGAPPAEVQEDPHRGEDPRGRYERQGYVVLGADDDLAFKGPPTESFETIDKQLDKLVDEIFRVAGQMAASVSSTSKALGRSGESKAFDHKDFIAVVGAIAAVVADGARRTYKVISDARGEDVIWTVHGLDGYEDDEDRSQLLEEALQADALAIPSRTWLTEYKTRAALRLVHGLDAATQGIIRDEIANGTTVEQTLPAPAAPPPPVEDEAPDSADAAEAEKKK